MRAAVFSAALAALSLVSPSAAEAQGGRGSTGAVFLATNDVSRNEIVMYDRAANGKLRLVGRFPTGGRGQGGTNDPLQSQNSIVLNEDHSYLLAVNAGSSDISVFRVLSTGLILTELQPSGGGNPVSIAIHDDLVYVVNFGGNYHTAGFRLQPWGGLKPINNSRYTLSGLDPNASSAAFSPDGTKLVISERVGNNVDVFSVNADGSLSNPVFNKSAGIEPFGLTFSPTGTLLVTETGGGPPAGGSTTSYRVNADNTLTPISPKANASGGATCWVVTNGQYAWVSNTTSSSVGYFALTGSGELTPLGEAAQEAAPPGAPLGTSFPLDVALTRDSKYLYVFYSVLGRVVGYQVKDDGGLTQVTTVTSVKGSTGAQGLAAY